MGIFCLLSLIFIAAASGLFSKPTINYNKKEEIQK